MRSTRLCALSGALVLAGLAASPSAALAEARQLTFSNSDGQPAWSPDGTTIVFSSERSGSNGLDLWLVPSAGGPEVHLTNAVSNEYGAAWSPDGQSIVYYWAWEANLYIIPALGGTEVPFTSSSGSDLQPAWSPDGTAIAFTSNRSADGGFDDDIWIKPYPSGAAWQLTGHPADDADPTWSPDGSTIAFISERGGPPQLWTIPAAGGNAVRVADQMALEPAWSPNGEWIAFVSNFDIHLISPNGGDAIPVTAGDELDFHPAWSPSGNEIVFMRRVGSDFNLWVVDIGTVSIERETWAKIRSRYR